MIKIRTENGLWQAEPAVLQSLHFETCSAVGCNAGELHYPVNHPKPWCPMCKGFLLGKDLVEEYGKRIDYHLEA